MTETGDSLLLDLLREYVVREQRAPFAVLSDREASEAALRFAQGELSAFRALERTLSNPAERLKRLLSEKQKGDL